MDRKQKMNMLDSYIYDYMMKKNLHQSAEAFLNEAQLSVGPIGLNPPGGFLAEWWPIFWDVYRSRGAEHVGQPAMPLPDIGDGWQHVAPTILEPGFNAVQEETRNDMAAGAVEAPDLLIAPVAHLNSSMSTGCQPISAHNYWPSAAMVPPPLAPLPAEVPPPLAPLPAMVPPPLAPLPAEVPPIAPQLLPNDPNETGKDTVEDQNPSQEHPLHRFHSAHNSRVPLPKNPFPSSSTALEQNNKPSKGKAKMAESAPAKKGRWGLPFWIYDSTKEKPLLIGQKPSAESTAKKQKTWENNAAEKQKSQDVKVGSFIPNQAIGKGISHSFSSTPPQSSLPAEIILQQGIAFHQVGSLHLAKSRLTCCDFSNPAKFLIAGGHEKVFTWNLKQSNTEITERHAQLITDARFRPNSYIFATSSFDKSIKIWDADLGKLICEIRHTEPVMSLDFHSMNTNLLCSCDRNDVIKFWDVKEAVSYYTLKGGSKQVRFQPQNGNILAAATGNVINLIDLDTGVIHSKLQGHVKDVRSISWDVYGQYLVSVSDESARIWSISSGGNCIHQLQSSGNKFESCTFHPAYDQLVVLGSYQTIGIWSPTMRNEIMPIPRFHEGSVFALASATDETMVASAGQDETFSEMVVIDEGDAEQRQGDEEDRHEADEEDSSCSSGPI